MGPVDRPLASGMVVSGGCMAVRNSGAVPSARAAQTNDPISSRMSSGPLEGAYRLQMQACWPFWLPPPSAIPNAVQPTCLPYSASVVGVQPLAWPPSVMYTSTHGLILLLFLYSHMRHQ